MLPFSEPCERNKDAILDILKRVFDDRTSVLEIGSGTGQHACYFAQNLPYLNWQPTDFGDYLPGLEARLNLSDLPNLPTAIELDVRTGDVPQGGFDAVFSANTLHIMSADAVECVFSLVGKVLETGGLLAVYGPFNYNGVYSSESNQRFDVWLKSQNPESAIRDFEWVDSLAKEAGFEFLEDNVMPANNQLLVWRKRGGAIDAIPKK